MTSFRVAWALAVSATALTASPSTDQQAPPVFRAASQTVVVYPTVHDAEGRLVPDLRKEDFTALDNGKPAAVTVFSKEIQTLTVAFLLDMSGSMTPRYLKARAGAMHFIEALLPPDRVRIGSFGSEVVLSPHLTGDKPLLRRILQEELWPGSNTPLWNAVHAGMVSLATEPGRRVVLIVTDGFDTGGLPGLEGSPGSVRKLATRDGFMVYAIGMASLMPLEPGLVDIVDDTGGGRFHVKDDDDLAATFARVADELRHQYVLGFTPVTLDGKEHKLEVRAKPGMKVRARRTFVAAR
jgi:Ca-activated chloride channel family protein